MTETQELIAPVEPALTCPGIDEALALTTDPALRAALERVRFANSNMRHSMWTFKAWADDRASALEHLVAERDAVVHDTRRLLVERDAATRAWEESSHAMDQWRAKALAAEDRLDAAVAAEREACALIAEMHEHRGEIASAIRTRNAGSGE